MKVTVPPKAVLAQFEAISESFLKKKLSLTIAQQNLMTSRDRLLTRLISGKLDVENLDIRFPKSMEESIA